MPASLNTSPSAPPGDPTLRPPPKHPSSKSRFLDVPPSPKGGTSLKPPLSPLGPASPTTPKQPTQTGGRSPQSGISSFLPGRQRVSLDAGEGWGTEQGLPASLQPVRSHLTMGIMQQDEERRASNAQAETSSSPPAATHHSPSRQKELNTPSSPEGSFSRSAQQQKAAAGPRTPFELASWKFSEEQGAASPHRWENHNGSLSRTAAQTESHCNGKAATRHLNGKLTHPVSVPESCGRRSSASLPDLSQQDGQKEGLIGGSSSEPEKRLRQTLRIPKYVSFSCTALLPSCVGASTVLKPYTSCQ